jgi:hypothetical protein
MEPLMEKVVTEQLAHSGGLAKAHVAAMDPMAKKALTEFQRSETLRSADFATPFKPAATQEALFQSPLLVTDIDATALPGGQVRIGFSEKLSGRKSSRSFEMGFSTQLMHAFTHLLERAIAQSNWRALAAGAGAAAPDATNAPVKPAYLN